MGGQHTTWEDEGAMLTAIVGCPGLVCRIEALQRMSLADKILYLDLAECVAYRS